jgi:hypothetical protein
MMGMRGMIRIVGIFSIGVGRGLFISYIYDYYSDINFNIRRFLYESRMFEMSSILRNLWCGEF